VAAEYTRANIIIAAQGALLTDEGDNMIGIIVWYKMILRIHESKIKRLVDLYNLGFLPKNLRKALEIIEGLPIED
jgi:hypothetical protein